MSEIVDILKIPGASEPTFTVDTAAAGGYVYSTVLAYTALENALNFTVFPLGDSFRILTAGVVFPEGFTVFKGSAVYVNPPSIRLALKGKASGTLYTIDVLSSAGVAPITAVPMENFEFALDVFCNVTEQVAIIGGAALNEEFELVISMGSIPISMLNVPAAYHTKVFYICPFVKILHNFHLDV